MAASRPHPGERLYGLAMMSPAATVLSYLPGQTLRLDPNGMILETWGPGVSGAPRLRSGDRIADAFPRAQPAVMERAQLTRCSSRTLP